MPVYLMRENSRKMDKHTKEINLKNENISVINMLAFVAKNLCGKSLQNIHIHMPLAYQCCSGS